MEIDDGLYSGLFVIIGTKKSTFRKTFFHLTAGNGDEFWIRLKRGDHKNGIPFRPLRKVANIESHPAVGTRDHHGEEDDGELALQQSVAH